MDVREAILDSAERRMRQGGFHACSFSEIASDVGIKSASVHYHFETKAHLGAALVARYEARVLALIGDREVGEGTGSSKKEAAQKAAEDALHKLGEVDVFRN